MKINHINRCAEYPSKADQHTLRVKARLDSAVNLAKIKSYLIYCKVNNITPEAVSGPYQFTPDENYYVTEFLYPAHERQRQDVFLTADMLQLLVNNDPEILSLLMTAYVQGRTPTEAIEIFLNTEMTISDAAGLVAMIKEHGDESLNAVMTAVAGCLPMADAIAMVEANLLNGNRLQELQPVSQGVQQSWVRPRRRF
jgi:hypothetical protein